VRQQGKAYMFSSPVVGSDIVFIGVLNGTLEARDVKTGSLLWDFKVEKSNKTTDGYSQAIESLMGHFSFIPTGVKHHLWEPINKFDSAEFILRLWL